MPTGLMQLLSYGSHNLYLTGNPQITFFKTVYKRHTNFAMEYIRQDFISSPSSSTTDGTTIKAKIGRNGDLIYDIYFVFTLPDIYSDTTNNFSWTSDIGYKLLNSVELSVGGHIIDKQYGIWMRIWNELNPLNPASYERMIGNNRFFTTPFPYYGLLENKFQNDEEPIPGDRIYPSIRSRRLYIPLEFWFCKNSGLALPLVALQYTEVFINIELNPVNNLYTIGDPAVSPCKLFNNPVITETSNHRQILNDVKGKWTEKTIFWRYVNGTNAPQGNWDPNVYLDVNYIYLDTNEQRKFAQSSHDYLITQIQQRTYCGLNEHNILNLQLCLPVIELIWVFRRDDVVTNNTWTNFTNILYPSTFVEVANIKNKYDTLTCLNDLDTCGNCNDIDYMDNIRNTVLSSGLTVEQFWKFINLNDSNDPSFSDPEIFENYFNIMYTASMTFNGKERTSTRDHIFYQALQTYKYHDTSPLNDSKKAGIYAYSFAIHPEDYQPSGSTNFSRINTAELEVNLRNVEDYKFDMFLYARTYNIFRIAGGIGGLAFAS